MGIVLQQLNIFQQNQIKRLNLTFDRVNQVFFIEFYFKINALTSTNQEKPGQFKIKNE